MSPTIGLPPPDSIRYLDTSRRSRFKGGTLIAEDVRDLAEHRERLADPDRYRPKRCARCGHDRLHVHSRPERHPLGEPSLPPSLVVLQFLCAAKACRATWRILPVFLARHLWHSWTPVEQSVRPVAPSPAGAAPPRSSAPKIAPRTQARWTSRLASSARVVVAVLAASAGAVLEALAKQVGLLGTRGELVDAYAAATAPSAGWVLASLAAIIHRLERGIRLM